MPKLHGDTKKMCGQRWAGFTGWLWGINMLLQRSIATINFIAACAVKTRAAAYFYIKYRSKHLAQRHWVYEQMGH
jgi:hypothetical protein